MKKLLTAVLAVCPKKGGTVTRTVTHRPSTCWS
jgi:hypothetical protein